MTDEIDNDDIDIDENINDDDNKATDTEVAELIKSQAARIKELESENASITDLKTEVEGLQSTLGSRSSLAELVEQVKIMNADHKAEQQTEQEKAMSKLQKVAEAGDMKAYRQMRKKDLRKISEQDYA